MLDRRDLRGVERRPGWSTTGLKLTVPAWSTTYAPTGNAGIWAPDIVYFHNKYYIYYSFCASVPKAPCVIGLYTTPTLDSTAAGYKLTDEGMVVNNPTNDATYQFSTIDPGPIVDPSGNLWTSWGSGYGKDQKLTQLWLTRLDTTGLPLVSDSAYKPPAVLGHPLETGRREGSYVHYRDGYYYLFWNEGGCCAGTASTYTIWVARSQGSITGPYSGNRVFYAGGGNIHGPGHMGIYSACGVERFTYHYYPTATSILGENDLTWSSDGWPVAGAMSTTPLKPCGDTGTGGQGGQAWNRRRERWRWERSGRRWCRRHGPGRRNRRGGAGASGRRWRRNGRRRRRRHGSGRRDRERGLWRGGRRWERQRAAAVAEAKRARAVPQAPAAMGAPHLRGRTVHETTAGDASAGVTDGAAGSSAAAGGCACGLAPSGSAGNLGATALLVGLMLGLRRPRVRKWSARAVTSFCKQRSERQTLARLLCVLVLSFLAACGASETTSGGTGGQGAGGSCWRDRPNWRGRLRRWRGPEWCGRNRGRPSRQPRQRADGWRKRSPRRAAQQSVQADRAPPPAAHSEREAWSERRAHSEQPAWSERRARPEPAARLRPRRRSFKTTCSGRTPPATRSTHRAAPSSRWAEPTIGTETNTREPSRTRRIRRPRTRSSPSTG